MSSDSYDRYKRYHIVSAIIFTGIIIASFLIFLLPHLKNKNVLKNEQFALFVDNVIVQKQEPTVFWVSNNTLQNNDFQSQLNILRLVAQENSFTKVKPYRKCGNILNSKIVNQTSSHDYCVAEICTPDSDSCTYIFGYFEAGVSSRQTVKMLVSKDGQSTTNDLIEELETP
ncbi:hypothetical protein KC878_02555 [Candidatus Saccharibacteria bacterium]|nr:hypothetical protein [Candidatus Saccharibacteria bacterium]MCB9821664.1 hypothetical protein [Candidatus Nomurabacteria bacterium]